MEEFIADKDYTAILRKISGKSIKESFAIYNEIFFADIDDIKDMLFMVYENKDTLEPAATEKRQEYDIVGLFHKRQILALEGIFRYIYIVELFDDETYYQNSKSGKLKGKVKEVRKYNFNFEYKDYVDKRKNTFLDLLDFIKADMNGDWAERYALTRFNPRLFSNLCKYRGKPFVEYENKFSYFCSEVEKKIKPNNSYRQELSGKIKTVQNLHELVKYIQKNRSKLLDKSEKLYKRNDNVKNAYFFNAAGRSTSLMLYDGLSFNSALPFYYQYRNYKYATQLLLNVFYENITLTEEQRIEKELIRAKTFYKEQRIIEQSKVDTKLYGLYFPLFMNFRQSVELSYKLLLVNEDMKKRELDKEQFKVYVDKMDTHDLIKLLELIEPYMEQWEYEYLWKLTSFIYYNEGKDVAFSRYLINNKFDLDSFREISIDYVDISNYIREFYIVMDNILSRTDFGFELDNIF